MHRNARPVSSNLNASRDYDVRQSRSLRQTKGENVTYLPQLKGRQPAKASRQNLSSAAKAAQSSAARASLASARSWWKCKTISPAV